MTDTMVSESEQEIGNGSTGAITAPSAPEGFWHLKVTDQADMTEAEANLAVDIWTGIRSFQRWFLLAMYERNAHRAMFYGDFTVFAQEQLGLTLSERSIKAHIAAARVERNVFGVPQIESSETDGEIRITNAPPKLPLNCAEELSRLPAEFQREAWQEVEAISPIKAKVFETIQEIVARRLEEAGQTPEEGETGEDTKATPKQEKEVPLKGYEYVKGSIKIVGQFIHLRFKNRENGKTSKYVFPSAELTALGWTSPEPAPDPEVVAVVEKEKERVRKVKERKKLDPEPEAEGTPAPEPVEGSHEG